MYLYIHIQYVRVYVFIYICILAPGPQGSCDLLLRFPKLPRRLQDVIHAGVALLEDMTTNQHKIAYRLLGHLSANY